MIFLNVAYAQKDHAKSLGAKWDAQKKKWYAPDESFKELIDTYGGGSGSGGSGGSGGSPGATTSVTIHKMPAGYKSGGGGGGGGGGSSASASKPKVSIKKANHPTNYDFDDDDDGFEN